VKKWYHPTNPYALDGRRLEILPPRLTDLSATTKIFVGRLDPAVPLVGPPYPPYQSTPVDPQLETARLQPLSLPLDPS
jgi:hypothetical protein